MCVCVCVCVCVCERERVLHGSWLLGKPVKQNRWKVRQLSVSLVRKRGRWSQSPALRATAPFSTQARN